MDNLKRYIKKRFCRHKDVELIRWCIKHIPDYEPSYIVAEYRCKECNTYRYEYYKGVEKKKWIDTYGDFKRENFNRTR